MPFNNEKLIMSIMPRRLWHKMVNYLEAMRDDAAEYVSDYKDKEDDYHTEQVQEKTVIVRDIDLIIGALYGEANNE